MMERIRDCIRILVVLLEVIIILGVTCMLHQHSGHDIQSVCSTVLHHYSIRGPQFTD